MKLQFRRRHEQRTDYKKRLRLLLSGKTRLVVRKTLKNYLVQFVDYESKGDKILVAANSIELKKFGWKLSTGNTSAAYLTGFLCGMKAKDKVKEAILDIGLRTSTKGGSIYAVLKGAVDAGVAIPHDASMLPSVDRIAGKHIMSYTEALKKSDQAEFKKRFSSFEKTGLKPEELQTHFEQAKKAIESKF